MFLSILAKLLFKASIPLILIAGIFTYGFYMKGGDPAALWKNAGSGMVAQLGSLFSGVKKDAGKAVDTLERVAGEGLVGSTNGQTQVFTWKDADGVTHYSSEAPTGAHSRKMSVNPNQNVLAPVKVPTASKTAQTEVARAPAKIGARATSASVSGAAGRESESEGYADPAVQEVADQLGGDIPGVVGQVLSSQSGDSSGALNPKQLLKMLQSK